MILFDIETNGLLDTLTKVHCICAVDTESKEQFQFGPTQISEGVGFLMEALSTKKGLAGHNIITFDIPALEKLYPEFRVERNERDLIFDTMTASYLIYSNVADSDYGLLRKGKMPRGLVGKHKLEAWGYRLGEYKGDYGKGEGDVWAVWSQEMQDYCMQDVIVNLQLYELLMSKPYSDKAMTLEHEAQWLMAIQNRNGFPFNIEKARELHKQLMIDLAKYEPLVVQMIPEVPDKVDANGQPVPFIPKRDNKRLGYKAGVPIFKMKDFNPNSRKQSEWVIRHMFGYSPDYEELYDITDTNEPFHPDKYRLKLDDITMKYLEEDEDAPAEVRKLASLLNPIFTIKKRLGQIADGEHSWFNHYNEKTKSIHGRVVPNSCVSGRAAHSSPNLGQVPAVKSLYGTECRELFESNHLGNDWVHLGVDASGLELRCLAHYMARYDGGAYGEEILNGDIHTANQIAAGLPTRDNAKTFIYGFLYGAGDAKTGKIVGADATVGRKLKKQFLDATPAIRDLRNAVESALIERTGRSYKWKRRFLRGLDGRPLHVRSPHSALNLLLQSCGALICKKWIVEWERLAIEKYGYRHGWDGDFAFMMWVHDEEQLACRTMEIAEHMREIAAEAMTNTEKFFEFKIKLEVEGKIGKNWRDCH